MARRSGRILCRTIVLVLAVVASALPARSRLGPIHGFSAALAAPRGGIFFLGRMVEAEPHQKTGVT